MSNACHKSISKVNIWVDQRFRFGRVKYSSSCIPKSSGKLAQESRAEIVTRGKARSRPATGFLGPNEEVFCCDCTIKGRIYDAWKPWGYNYSIKKPSCSSKGMSTHMNNKPLCSYKNNVCKVNIQTNERVTNWYLSPTKASQVSVWRPNFLSL